MPSVVLIRPVYDPASRSLPVFPWALLYLAAPLVERGYDVHLHDAALPSNSPEELRDLLERVEPAVVGISAMTGEQIRYGLEAAAFVRECCDTAIVWGGVHPSLLPEQTARHELVDFVVAGEGERAFPALVDALVSTGAIDTIPGVYAHHDGFAVGTPARELVDLSAVPPLPYNLIDVERYIAPRPGLGVERYFEICTSRGCPHDCGFCYIEAVHGSRWRPMAADEAVARIREHAEHFNLDGLLFREDNFFVDRKRVEAIARGLIEAKVSVKWAASCRVNYFAKYPPEFIGLLKDSGCALLTFGVESGSDRVLKFIKKGITSAMVLKTARLLREHGINSTFHFMGGFPSETREELLETCRLIDKLRHIDSSCVVREMSVFAPYPGVGLISECTARGYREPEDLESWIAMDWKNTRRPWLTEDQSRLLGDVQFLIARLDHPNPLVGGWARWRWRHMLGAKRGVKLYERPVMEKLKSFLGRG